MPMVFVAREVVVRAPRQRVWETVVDPTRMAALDPRLSLVSAAGERGVASSGYVVDVQGRFGTARFECSVVEAEAGVRVVTERRRGAGRVVAYEERFSDTPDGGTKVIRLIRAAAPPGLGWLGSYLHRQELSVWIQKLKAEAERPEATVSEATVSEATAPHVGRPEPAGAEADGVVRTASPVPPEVESPGDAEAGTAPRQG